MATSIVYILRALGSSCGADEHARHSQVSGEAHWGAQWAAEPSGELEVAEALVRHDGCQGHAILLQDS